MATPEQYIHFAPQDTSAGPGVGTGNLPGPEFSQQQEPAAETEQLISPLQPHAQGLLGLAAEGQNPPLGEEFAAIRAARRARGEETGEVPPIAGGEDKDKSDSRTGTKIIGRADFSWRKDLSENGKKLYLLLLKEMGDVDFLPTHAVEEELDLDTALDELRTHALLDESDPEIIKLISRTL